MDKLPDCPFDGRDTCAMHAPWRKGGISCESEYEVDSHEGTHVLCALDLSPEDMEALQEIARKEDSEEELGEEETDEEFSNRMYLEYVLPYILTRLPAFQPMSIE